MKKIFAISLALKKMAFAQVIDNYAKTVVATNTENLMYTIPMYFGTPSQTQNARFIVDTTNSATSVISVNCVNC